MLQSVRIVSFITMALLPPAAQAAEPAPDLRPVASRLVKEVIRPAYAALAAAARVTAEDWEAECRRPRPARDRLRADYRVLATNWWTVETIRFGPVSDDFRAERLNFWPDKRNATTRGLAALLDPAAVLPDRDKLRSESAAVQGLPALERILFDHKGGVLPRECAIGLAIARNVEDLAGAIDTEWTALEARAGTDADFARDLATRLVTDVIGEFQVIIDSKLGALGKTMDDAKPDALEARRSGLERDALARPIAALERLASVMVNGQRDGATLVATLETARSVAESLPQAIGPMLTDPTRRPRVVLLRDALRSAQDAALSDLPALVGVTVGFNSRDGD